MYLYDEKKKQKHTLRCSRCGKYIRLMESYGIGNKAYHTHCFLGWLKEQKEKSRNNDFVVDG